LYIIRVQKNFYRLEIKGGFKMQRIFSALFVMLITSIIMRLSGYEALFVPFRFMGLVLFCMVVVFALGVLCSNND
jgi:small neutral amino acid transporter SnatA (MarC family)